MIFQEVKWVRSNSSKLCPLLKTAILGWYRTSKVLPCYLQRIVKSFKQRFIRIPVIVQTVQNLADYRMSCHNFAKSFGCKVHKDLSLINAFSTRVSAKKLQDLAKSSLVKKIWYDREIKALLDTASPTVGAETLWAKGITGKGIGVAVIDTGVFNHPDLEGRITGFKDFVKKKTAPYDDNGHGTHVAGNIAGNGKSSNHTYQGPANEASIIGVKVLNKMGSGSLSAIIEGIQWCLAEKDSLNIRVINLSLGSSATESYKEDPVCQAAERAWQAGIVVCAAAGNSGPGEKTINSPGIDPLIITVGALDDNNTAALEDNSVADFSSRGPTVDGLVKPDLLSPGANIVSLRSPGSFLDKTNKEYRVDNWYTSLSGTSMATPVCAGLVAQILEKESTLTPDQVKTCLILTALKLPAADDNSQGAGLIRAEQAVQLAEQRTSPAAPRLYQP